MKYYLGEMGLTTITDPDLAYVNILRVTKDGQVHTAIEGTPATGALDFGYEPGLGKVLFDPANPFPGSPTGRPNRAFMSKITVKYEI